jgi:uncharacterized protein
MIQNDFDYAILEVTGHRPWPMPASPWVMTQTWHDLLFAHWRIDATTLAASIPSPLQLDLYDGDAWLGIVPFHMTNVAPRGVPALPWVSAFPELNVRTYVRVGDKPGVYFFSLDAGNPLAVIAARWLFNLPYYSAAMTVTAEGATIHYRSRRAGKQRAELVASYLPTGGVFHAPPRSLEYFLTERYCLYTIDRARRARRVDIHHRPWPLQAAAGSFQVNTMAEATGLALTADAPVLHFAKRQDTVAWLPVSPD